jgi:hypothetical protein
MTSRASLRRRLQLTQLRLDHWQAGDDCQIHNVIRAQPINFRDLLDLLAKITFGPDLERLIAAARYSWFSHTPAEYAFYIHCQTNSLQFAYFYIFLLPVKSKTPLSLKLEPETERKLEEAAERLGMKKYSLAILAIKAAVNAIEINDNRIVLPIEFDVTHVPVPKQESTPQTSAGRDTTEQVRVEDAPPAPVKYPSHKSRGQPMHDNRAAHAR